MQPFDKNTLQQFEAGYQAYRKTLGPSKQQVALQKKHQGNIFTHLLPTIGGTGGGIAGGAAGGALAGSILLPGIGTAAGGLIGALVGGATGGAGGKVIENKLEGKSLNSGVTRQAAEQGVLSAGPLRLLKGASIGVKAGTVAAREGEGLSGAINALATKANTPLLKGGAKNLMTQGQQAQGRVAGVSAGQKIAGKELTPQDTAKMLQTLKNEGIKTGNANNTFQALQEKLNQYGGQISDHFTTNNAPIAKKDLSSLAKQYIGSLKTSDPTINKQAQILATDLKNNVSDTKSLWEFRKQLDTMIPDAKQGLDNTGAAKTIALKNMRQFITKQLGDVPGAKNYHSLSEIKPFVSAESRRLNNPGGGIVGRIASSGPVQKVEQLAGRGAETAGKLVGGNGQRSAMAGLTPGAIAGRTVPVGVLQASAGMQPQPQTQPQTQAIDPSQQTGDLTSALMNAQDPSLQQQQETSPYSREALVSDIQRDPKNASKYIDTYNSLQDIYAPAASTKGYNTTASGVIADTKTGLNSLQQLYQQLSSNSANDPVIGKLRSLNPLDTNAKTLNQQIATTKQIVGKALEGGVLRKEDEAKYAAILPTINDTDEVAKQKIQYLYNQIAGRLQIFQDSLASGGGGSNDLTNALMQSGYGQ